MSQRTLWEAVEANTIRSEQIAKKCETRTYRGPVHPQDKPEDGPHSNATREGQPQEDLMLDLLEVSSHGPR